MRQQRSVGGLRQLLTTPAGQEAQFLLEEPKTLDAELLRGEEAEAKVEEKKLRPGLTMFTDGSRLDDGAAR